MEKSSTTRFVRVLTGERLSPPARGLTFVDPALLPGPGGAARRPAKALAHACADLRLDFAFVPSWEPWAFDALRELAAARVAALWVVPGVWWPALETLGVERALRLAAREPSVLASEFDRSMPVVLSAASAGLEAGADALVVADDLAGDAGPFAAPQLLAAEVFPRLGRIAAVAADAGAPALLHCDGDARSLFAFARGSGFSAVHGDCGGSTLVAGALAAARAEGLVLVGGLPSSVLTDPLGGTLAGAVAATMAEGSGLLVADDGGLSTPGQVAALFAALGAAGRA